MSDKEIKKYIDRLNNNQGQKTIFLEEISKAVDYATVYSKVPSKGYIIDPFSKHRFYFIKNDKTSKYIGAVHNGGSDLHWYIIPKHRKKGHLTKALKNYILKDILDKKETQKISISKSSLTKENYENSLKVALKCGFKITTENKYITLLEINALKQ